MWPYSRGPRDFQTFPPPTQHHTYSIPPPLPPSPAMATGHISNFSSVQYPHHLLYGGDTRCQTQRITPSRASPYPLGNIHVPQPPLRPPDFGYSYRQEALAPTPRQFLPLSSPHRTFEPPRFSPGERLSPPSWIVSSTAMPVMSMPKARVINVNNILNAALSHSRPPKIVIILRGLPGAGKSYAARAIKEKELALSGKNPRILSIDDYFMSDSEGNSAPEYEFEKALEPSYRTSLLKSFKKTVDDGLFPFIVVDSCNDKVSYFDEFVAYAMSRGFTVYVGTVVTDVDTCKIRSQGRRCPDDVENMARFFELTPDNFLQLDLTQLIHPDINTVEMEDAISDTVDNASVDRKRRLDETPSKPEGEYSSSKKSKWEMMDPTEEQIDRLDGLPRLKSSHSRTVRQNMVPFEKGGLFSESGVAIFENINLYKPPMKHKKHVSWADVEQYKRSLKDSHNQFDRMLSEINARSALTKVHLI